MASKTKIYIVLEYVDGGELFDEIVSCHCLEFRDIIPFEELLAFINAIPIFL